MPTSDMFSVRGIGVAVIDSGIDAAHIDLDELFWDSRGNLGLNGRLATDRPHVVKLYGSYLFPFGTQIGAFFYGGSGTPVSKLSSISGATANASPPVPDAASAPAT